MDHGLPTDRKYLFVIEGAKALRAGIEELFGAAQPVQRCRNHKMRNVLGELPKEQHAQTPRTIEQRSAAAGSESWSPSAQILTEIAEEQSA